MKRFFYAALAAMLFVCVLAVSVSAAQEPSASLVPKDETAGSGETVEIAVMVESQNTATVGLIPAWDKNLFEWTGGSWESFRDISLQNFTIGAGVASCAFTSPTNISGKLLTLTFDVKEGVELGDTKIDVKLLVKSDGVTKQIDVSADIEIVGVSTLREAINLL